MIRPEAAAQSKPAQQSRPSQQAPVASTQPAQNQPSPAPTKNSTATAIYVACGVILLSAIIFAAPSFLNSNKSQAENSKNEPKKNDGEKKAEEKKSSEVVPKDNTKGESKKSDEKKEEKKSEPNNVKTETKNTNEKTSVPENKKSTDTDNDSKPKKADDDPDRPGKKNPVKNPVNKDDDPDRPRDRDPVINDLQDLKPVGGLAGFQKMLTSPPPRQRFSRPLVIVQIPRPLPPKKSAPKAAPKTKTKAKPVVTVDFKPKPTTPLLLDHQANPGTTVEIELNLTGTPPSAVTVDVKTPTGIISNMGSVTFPANVAPTKQTITLTGDGTALGTNQSKLDQVVFSAKSTGLTAANTTNYPIRVVRRNRYILFNPAPGGAVVVLARADQWLPSRSDTWIAFFPGAWPPIPPVIAGTAPTNASEYYTKDHVEIVESGTGGLRFRLTDTGITWQTTVGGAFAPVPGLAGWVTSWQ